MVIEVITPEKIVYKDDIDELVVPTVNGQITILPNHVGLLTKVTPGELIIKKSTSQELLAITGGFLEVAKNHICILADYAIRAKDVEVAKAQEAQKRAENLIKEKANEKDFKIAQTELVKAILQLKVAEKYRRRSPKIPANN